MKKMELDLKKNLANKKKSVTTKKVNKKPAAKKACS